MGAGQQGKGRENKSHGGGGGTLWRGYLMVSASSQIPSILFFEPFAPSPSFPTALAPRNGSADLERKVEKGWEVVIAHPFSCSASTELLFSSVSIAPHPIIILFSYSFLDSYFLPLRFFQEVIFVGRYISFIQRFLVQCVYILRKIVLQIYRQEKGRDEVRIGHGGRRQRAGERGDSKQHRSSPQGVRAPRHLHQDW